MPTKVQNAQIFLFSLVVGIGMIYGGFHLGRNNGHLLLQTFRIGECVEHLPFDPKPKEAWEKTEEQDFFLVEEEGQEAYRVSHYSAILKTWMKNQSIKKSSANFYKVVSCRH